MKEVRCRTVPAVTLSTASSTRAAVSKAEAGRRAVGAGKGANGGGSSKGNQANQGNESDAGIAAELLQAYGVRPTALRVHVLGAVRHLDGLLRYFTSKRLYEHLLQRDVSVGLHAVYRVLATLVDKGLVERFQANGDPSVYRFKREALGRAGDEPAGIAQMICRRCHGITRLDGAEAQRLLQALAGPQHFTTQEFSIALLGHCAGCADAAD